MIEDLTLTCRNCHQAFAWTARDQEFFARMAFEKPVRCKACRAKRKAEREGGAPPPAREVVVEHRTASSTRPAEEGDGVLVIPERPVKKRRRYRERDEDSDWG